MLSHRTILLHTTAAAALLTAGSVAAQTTVISGGGGDAGSPTYEASFIDSALSPSFVFGYSSSSSGAGQTAFLTNTSAAFGNTPVNSGSFTGTPADLPNVDFTASDAALTSAQVSKFSTSFGFPLIQAPTMGMPVTLPFKIAGLTTNGSVNLTDAEVCGIFSGKITNWSGVAAHPTTAQIKIVYRSDAAGTTFLLSQHFAAVCTTTNSDFKLPFTPSTNFASMFTTVPTNFTGVSGEAGVQSTVLAAANTIGYTGPDFTKIAALHSADSSFPPVASVTNAHSGVATLPATGNTFTALGLAKIPGEPSNTTGVPTVTTDPTHWVPVAADPTAGYPIVGYTTWEMSSCYKTTAAGVVTGIDDFLKDFVTTAGTESGPVGTEIRNRGFVRLPTALGNAVVSAFLTSGSTLALKTCSSASAR